MNSKAGRRTLLYFGYSPAEGAGSAIIVYRHLLRFAAEGWDVRIVADWGQSDATARQHGWPVFTLSHRKPWWPSFKPERNGVFSRTVRGWLWAGEVDQWLGGVRPTALFTYLSAFSDTLSIAAVGYARRYDTPLATIVHDDARCFADAPTAAARAHARRQWIVQNSEKAWFASPGLASCFFLPHRQTGVLPPIPEGYAASPEWKPEFATAPLVVYAGNYWPPQLPLLARLGREIAVAGGRLLLLVKPSPEIEALCQAEPISWRAPFAENREALAFLADHAAGLLVSYAETSEAMPWVRTSFPSKLIEYTHLGLPIMIYAPEDTAVAAWAQARGYPDFSTPQTAGAVARFVEALKDAASWREKGAASRRYAETEFDPAQIQQTLVASLCFSNL